MGMNTQQIGVYKLGLVVSITYFCVGDERSL